jgi:hypothetical protein
LSHTPEIYRQAAHANFDLLLSGHRHGGQICLPGSIRPSLQHAQTARRKSPCITCGVADSKLIWFIPQVGFVKKARGYEFADKKDPDAERYVRGLQRPHIAACQQRKDALRHLIKARRAAVWLQVHPVGLAIRVSPEIKEAIQ